VGVLVIRSYVYCTLTEVFLNLTEGFLILTEVFPCFFLSCKANARLKLAKTLHGPYFSKLVLICVVRLLVVLFYVLFVCKCVLPPGDNPSTVNKYIISYRNIGSRSRNHCCLKKAIIITYSECAFVTLFVQHAKRIHLLYCHLWRPVWLYHNFTRHLVNGTIFRRNCFT